MSQLALLMLLITGAPQTGAAGALPPRHPPLPPTVRPRSLLSPAERAAAPLTRDWLVGYWVWAGSMSHRALGAEDGICQADDATAILPDGTYRMGDGGGRWTFDGSRLTMLLEQVPSIQYMLLRLGDGGVARIRKTGPDEIGVRWSGAPEARFARCD